MREHNERLRRDNLTWPAFLARSRSETVRNAG
jgi:hypothetical protein